MVNVVIVQLCYVVSGHRSLYFLISHLLQITEAWWRVALVSLSVPCQALAVLLHWACAMVATYFPSMPSQPLATSIPFPPFAVFKVTVWRNPLDFAELCGFPVLRWLARGSRSYGPCFCQSLVRQTFIKAREPVFFHCWHCHQENALASASYLTKKTAVKVDVWIVHPSLKSNEGPPCLHLAVILFFTQNWAKSTKTVVLPDL